MGTRLRSESPARTTHENGRSGIIGSVHDESRPEEEESAMGVVEREHGTEHAPMSLVERNERLLAEAREERVRDEAVLRRAERRVRTGLEAIRRSTLRVVSD
jgi:hypothetical protein